MWSWADPIFGKNHVPEINVLSANQITGFLNQLFLHKESMKQPHFEHVDTNSQKLKVDWKCFVWAWSKMVWPICYLDFKIDYISRMNWWNKLIFTCWYRFTKIKTWSKIYWVSIIKNGCDQFGQGTLKLTVSQKNELME